MANTRDNSDQRFIDSSLQPELSNEIQKQHSQSENAVGQMILEPKDSFKLACVTDERVKRTENFKVLENSDISDKDLIGLVIYDLDAHNKFEFNGKHYEEGNIYIRTPESILNHPGGTYHEKLFNSLFNCEWEKLKNRITVSGFVRQDGVWKGNSSTFNSKLGDNYSQDNERIMSLYEFQKVVGTTEKFLYRPYLPGPNSIRDKPFPISSKEQESEEHPAFALEIYHDLVHIRNHVLGIDKETPKLLRIPVVSFLAAMSANQHSKHPVRDSLIDVGIEETALTTMGLAIGQGPAGITFLASHLAESGLKHFPTYEQISKMPLKTPQDGEAFTTMMMARSTAELIALPSKTAEIVSHFVKSFLDRNVSKVNPDQDLSLYNSLHDKPALTYQPSAAWQPIRVPLARQFKFKDLEPSKPVVESIALSATSAANFQSKSFQLPSKFKFELSEMKTASLGNMPSQPAYQVQDFGFSSTPIQSIKFPAEFKLCTGPKTYWDKLAANAEFPNTVSRKLCSFESSSSALVSSSVFSKSKGLSQLAPPTAWDRMREQGIQHLSRKFGK